MTSNMTPAYTALTDILATRRSIRSFTNEPIDDNTVRLLADAARFAPAAGNARRTGGQGAARGRRGKKEKEKNRKSHRTSPF